MNGDGMYVLGTPLPQDLDVTDSPIFADVTLRNPTVVSGQTIGSVAFVGTSSVELGSLDCIRQGTANTSRLEFRTMSVGVGTLAFVADPAGLRIGTGAQQYGHLDLTGQTNPTLAFQAEAAAGVPQIWLTHGAAGNTPHKVKVASSAVGNWGRGHFDVWINTAADLVSATVSDVRQRISGTTGNVLLGTTVDDSASVLQVSGNISLRNGTTVTQSLLHSTYTSATSFEALRTEATAAGSYRIGSAIGSAGGSNRNIEIGHYSSAGAFTSAVKIDTSGKTVIVPPTADPLVAGAIWNNAGTLAISAG